MESASLYQGPHATGLRGVFEHLQVVLYVRHNLIIRPLLDPSRPPEGIRIGSRLAPLSALVSKC
jgi:hypothetical protein